MQEDQRHLLRQLLTEVLIEHIDGQTVQEVLTQFLVLFRRNVHHLVLQGANTLADQNVGIGASVGRKQLLQLEFFLRHESVEFLFGKPLFTHFCQFFCDHAQIGIQLIARRLNVDGALRTLEQHTAVKAKTDILHVVLAQRLLNVPEQRFTRQIGTPVAQHRRGLADGLPGVIPHDGEAILTHGVRHNADRLCTQRRERRNRGWCFTLAFQITKCFVDLLHHRAAVHVTDHDQRHRIRGVPLLVERFYLFGVYRLFQRFGRVMSQ